MLISSCTLSVCIHFSWGSAVSEMQREIKGKYHFLTFPSWRCKLKVERSWDWVGQLLLLCFVFAEEVLLLFSFSFVVRVSKKPTCTHIRDSFEQHHPFPVSVLPSVSTSSFIACQPLTVVTTTTYSQGACGILFITRHSRLHVVLSVLGSYDVPTETQDADWII